MADRKKRRRWEDELDDTGTGGGDLADIFGDADDWSEPAPQSGILPEPMIVPHDDTPRRRVPIPASDLSSEEEIAERMRAGAEAMGVEIRHEARTGAAGIDNWEAALRHYLDVLQRKMSEAEDGEGLKLTLTTDPTIEAADQEKIAALIQQAFLERDAGEGEASFRELVGALYDEVVGLSVLAPLWRDPTITEILVDGWDDVYFERDGQLHATDIKFRDPQHLENVARRLAEVVSDRALSKTSPLVTARLPDSRVAFVFGDVAGEDGVYITIRKHHKRLTWEQLLAGNSMTQTMRDFLQMCVEARANILISGGTGAGKTTVINAVSAFIPDDERVITIEDSYELELRNRYWARLQSKTRASADDKVEITVSDLLRQTLRMRPDRIVVGEVRDGAAAAALLEASNTGHDGTLTTLHANSGWDAINSRLPGLYQGHTGAPSEVAKNEVSRAFELVVHVARRRGRRFVTEISEVGQFNPITGEIYLRRLFEGSLDADGQPTFRQLAWPAADGDLARKFEDAGITITVGNLYEPDSAAGGTPAAAVETATSDLETSSEEGQEKTAAGREKETASEAEECCEATATTGEEGSAESEDTEDGNESGGGAETEGDGGAVEPESEEEVKTAAAAESPWPWDDANEDEAEE